MCLEPDSSMHERGCKALMRTSASSWPHSDALTGYGLPVRLGSEPSAICTMQDLAGGGGEGIRGGNGGLSGWPGYAGGDGMDGIPLSTTSGEADDTSGGV